MLASLIQTYSTYSKCLTELMKKTPAPWVDIGCPVSAKDMELCGLLAWAIIVALHSSYHLDNVATEMQTTGSASVVLPVDIDYVCSRFYDGRHGFFKMPLV